MDSNLKGDTALATGAASCIGPVVALRYGAPMVNVRVLVP